jgi:hypothetical protein
MVRHARERLGPAVEVRRHDLDIEQMVEHRRTPQMADHHPRAYARLSREPGLIAFRLAKNPLSVS